MLEMLILAELFTATCFSVLSQNWAVLQGVAPLSPPARSTELHILQHKANEDVNASS